MTRGLSIVVFILLLIATALVVTRNASTNTNDVIIVSNADAHRQMDIAGNSLLNGTLGLVSARLRVQFAQALRRFELEPPSAPLTGILGSVEARVRLSFGDTLRRVDLAPAPSTLRNILGSVDDRIRLSFANSNRKEALIYPVALINDQAPPAITNVMSTSGGTISWTTDEFATSTVRYGTSPGVYTQTAADPSFVKVHQLQLENLQPGVRFYYVVSSTDLSGNTTTSSEFSSVQMQQIFLPGVIK